MADDKCKQSHVGHHVVIWFEMTDTGKMKPFLGQVRQETTILMDSNRIKTKYLVVFDDGEKKWFDLKEEETQGRLTWVKDPPLAQVASRSHQLEGSGKYHGGTNDKISRRWKEAIDQEFLHPEIRTAAIRNLVKFEEDINDNEFSSVGEVVACFKNFLKGFLARARSKVKHEIYIALIQAFLNADGDQMKPADRQDFMVLKRKAIEDVQRKNAMAERDPDSDTEIKRPQKRQRNAICPIPVPLPGNKGMVDAVGGRHPAGHTDEACIVAPVASASDSTNPSPPASSSNDSKEALKWLDDMEQWMRHVPHGPKNIVASDNNTKFTMGKVRMLATGEGIALSNWPNDVSFYSGIRVDLSFDFETMIDEAKAFEREYGSDLSNNRTLTGPLRRLKLYKEYLNISDTFDTFINEDRDLTLPTTSAICQPPSARGPGNSTQAISGYNSGSIRAARDCTERDSHSCATSAPEILAGRASAPVSDTSGPSALRHAQTKKQRHSQIARLVPAPDEFFAASTTVFPLNKSAVDGLVDDLFDKYRRKAAQSAPQGEELTEDDSFRAFRSVLEHDYMHGRIRFRFVSDAMYIAKYVQYHNSRFGGWSEQKVLDLRSVIGSMAQHTMNHTHQDKPQCKIHIVEQKPWP